MRVMGWVVVGGREKEKDGEGKRKKRAERRRNNLFSSIPCDQGQLLLHVLPDY